MTDKKDTALKLALEALNGSQYRMNQYGYQAMETSDSPSPTQPKALKTRPFNPERKQK